MPLKDATIAEFNAAMTGDQEQISMICFYSEWLPDGVKQSVLDYYEASAEKHPDVKFIQININTQTLIPMALELKAVPCVMAFRGNSHLGDKVGVINESLISQFILESKGQKEDLEF